MTPTRVQLSRKKGWKMSPNTVVLGWANDSSTQWLPFVHNSDNPAVLALECGHWMKMPGPPTKHKPVE